MGKLLAGAAMCKITPSLELLLRMSEAEGPRNKYDGIHEDTYMRFIALSDGERKIILAGADCGQFPMAQLIRDRIVEKYGVDPMGFIVSGTHNHECIGPRPKEGDDPWIMDRGEPSEPLQEYAQFVLEQAVNCIGEAIEKMQPARMGVNKGMSYINACRDLPTPIGAIQANNFHGPSDHELIVIKFESLSGEAIGMFVNHATHSNYMVWNLMDGSYPKWGADLGGGISCFVEKAHKNNIPVIWAKGCAGDQNPITRSTLRILDVDDDGNMSARQVTLSYPTGLAQMQALVATQGLEILQLEKEMTDFTEDFMFSSAETFREIPTRKSYNELKIAPKCNERPEPLESDKVMNMRFRLAVLNGIAFAGVSCEAYTKLGMIIKELVPCDTTVVTALSYGCMGYIPDEETEKINGFGTMNSLARSGAETEAAFIDGFKELISKVGL